MLAVQAEAVVNEFVHRPDEFVERMVRYLSQMMGQRAAGEKIA